MNQTVLSQIEQNIMQLSTDEQLLLISRVAEKLRQKAATDFEFENKLAEMADDADIQRELRNIEEDFRYTELDGLTE
ncbi:hypothetical protein BH20ACI4_BH20ACI4_16480 [soil metagenome]